MTSKNNHSPENWSEKYSYTPTIDDYMQVYRKYTRKSSQIIREKIRLCLMCELIGFVVAIFGIGITQNPIVMYIWLISFFAILGIVPTSYGFVYRCQISATIKTNPFLLERRYISFDGYHFISESDHLIQMFPIHNHVKTDIDKTGIYLICCDAIRYYLLRIFGSAAKMHEFYARLQWNDAYEDMYVKNQRNQTL